MKLDEIVAKLRGHPILAAMEREELQERLKKRSLMVATIGELERDFLRKLAGFETAATAAMAKVEAARAVLVDRENSLQGIKADEQHARDDYDRRRNILESELIRGADESIDQFISEMYADADRSRLSFRPTLGQGVDPSTGRHTVMSLSNAEPINRRLRAITASIDRAQQMKREAIDPEMEASTLQRLRDALPALDSGA